MIYVREAEVKDAVLAALKEDIGNRDITTEALISPDKSIKAVFLAKEPCVVCGLGVCALVFKTLDKKLRFKAHVSEGKFVKKGQIIATASGKAKSILTAERVALNFLSLLSGISTNTREFVNASKPHKAKIIDTRKTIPGLRLLQKYAVRIGGGFNHRMCLDEMILVKDNHLQVLGGLKALDDLARFRKGYQVEIEVKTLKEFIDALKLNPDIIMLDNMSLKDMKRAVEIKNNLFKKNPRRKIILEASGGITLENISKVAATGVDTISVGALTHSLDSVDISLEFV